MRNGSPRNGVERLVHRGRTYHLLVDCVPPRRLHVSSAGMMWLPIGVLAFIVSFITYLISRRTVEAAAEAIQRQFIEAPRNPEPVHEAAQ